ncbi:MAG: sigma-54 interaction domain-containing protein [Anaeromyxobacteraceae bacterium]
MITAARAATEQLSDADPIARSPAMREVLDAALDVAPTPTTVLLLGESGTGKELLARFLHARSERLGPWVAVNCAALPADLLESELFGHEKGAFTGAWDRRAGRFEQAHRGTLLLDEISELPLGLQAKLLRVVQEREVDRVGGARPVPVDVRLVATTNRDLGEMVRRGEFRSDLYYRLHVFPIVLPPLRDRREDLPALAEALVADAARALGRAAPVLSDDAFAALRAHPFPGNVRELRNVLERAMVRCRGGVIDAAMLGLAAATPTPTPTPTPTADPFTVSVAPEARSRRAPTWTPTSTDGTALFTTGHLPLDLSALERLAIIEALRRVRGNRTHAARLLGIGLRTLRNKLRAYREAGVEVEPADRADRPLVPIAVAPRAPDTEALRQSCRARVSQEDRS